MGLDIRAYQGLKLIGTAKNGEDYEDEYDWRKTFYAHPTYIDEADFPKHLEGSGLVAGGVYEYADDLKFRAGSYSNYNWWRNELAYMVLGVGSRIVRDSPGVYCDQPFYFLINFSDCEGIIAGDAAAKLKRDFEEWQEQADEHPSNYFREQYAQWRKAFEMAADSGAVDFH